MLSSLFAFFPNDFFCSRNFRLPLLHEAWEYNDLQHISPSCFPTLAHLLVNSHIKTFFYNGCIEDALLLVGILMGTLSLTSLSQSEWISISLAIPLQLMNGCHFLCHSDLCKSLLLFLEFEDILESLQCLSYYRDSVKVSEDIFSHCLSSYQHASKALKEQNLPTQLHLNAHCHFHSEVQRREQIKRLNSVFIPHS